MKANIRHETYLESLGISIKKNNHVNRYSMDELNIGKHDNEKQETENNRLNHLSSHIESSKV